jgi:hypothetical protein
MILIILLSLLFILVIIHLCSKQIEGFADSSQTTSQTPPLDNAFMNKYKSYSRFYDSFMKTWEKAIISSASLDIPREPLESPDQTPSGTPPTISRSDQQAYIKKLSEELKKPLPPTTDPLPSSTSINVSSLPDLMNRIPKDITPFQHALNWMNGNLQSSQDNLKKALQGIPFNIESFEDKCNGTSQCLLNNQEFIKKVGDQVCSSERKNQEQTIKDQQNELLQRMNSALNNQPLINSLQTNQILVSEAEKVKQQAESGELYKQVNIPDISIQFSPLAPGDLTLSNMEKTNPQEYNNLKDNYKPWFNMKSLIEQINRSV